MTLPLFFSGVFFDPLSFSELRCAHQAGFDMRMDRHALLRRIVCHPIPLFADRDARSAMFLISFILGEVVPASDANV